MAFSIRQSYYWQTVWEDCDKFARNCLNCQALGKCFEETMRPWEQIELYIHGPFPSSSHPSKFLITIQDVFSNYLLAKEANVSTAEALSRVCAEFSFSTFCAHEFKRCFFVTSDEHLFQHFLLNVGKLWRQINDEKLRVDQTFDRVASLRNLNLIHEMSDLVASNGDWDARLDVLMYMYRKRPVSGKAPINLAFPDKDKPEKSTTTTTKSGRQLRKTLMMCDHCGEQFTSKVSFKLHSDRHSHENPNPTTKPQTKRSPRVDKNEGEPSQKKILENPDPERVKELTESTVVTVKALLAATSEERKKRGKYIKYDQKLKDSVAEYAECHGIPNASKHFSEQLQHPISESTVRNFVYSSHAFLSEEEQTKIGKFACEFGTDACFKQFSSKHTLTKSIVNRLERLYRKSLNTVSDEINQVDGNCKRSFDAALKDEIGRYAFHRGNINAVNHYSLKLQFPVKESTVRKFKKSWMEKNSSSQVPCGSNQVSNVDYNQHSYSFSQEGSAQTNENPQEPQFNQMSSYDFSQPIPLTVTPSQPSTSSGPSRPTKAPLSKKKPKSERKVTAKKPKKSKVMIRGHYTNYDEKLRCEIASYALDHGNQETINYFRQQKGIQLPESTIRSLRARLQKHQDATGEPPTTLSRKRGPTIRLGAYDPIVKDCILKLAASGERLSAFVVIATAKLILNQNAPEVLAENGGDVDLTPAWAKSFLRRVGIKARDS